MALRNFIYDKVREASQAFGYQEWDAPFIEAIELYAAKSGEELVNKQSLCVRRSRRGQSGAPPGTDAEPGAPDRGEAGRADLPCALVVLRSVLALRTAAKGTFTREFFQWNIDMLGVNSPEADAELIAVGATFLRSVGLSPEQALIYVNNRRLMDSEFDALGIRAGEAAGCFQSGGPPHEDGTRQMGRVRARTWSDAGTTGRLEGYSR
ncbi:MAG: ATP phosphoribosyltransferase regulatory subunit [Ignavibacteriales bacterium]|nr:ATP phosphoribosyltransferase regulatory subunit [Ignavibacteriales bacterium]